MWTSSICAARPLRAKVFLARAILSAAYSSVVTCPPMAAHASASHSVD
jgi:hypothetical protein